MQIIQNSQAFPHIFRPLDLTYTSIANRIIMGSMHTGMEEDKHFERLAYFYKLRAQAGVGMIITGGFAPNFSGTLYPFAAKLTRVRESKRHELLTDTVHQFQTKILLQILDAGRYAYHPWAHAPSAIKSPITPFKPWSLSRRGIRACIKSFVRCAVLAKQAGYDGVELMGSEGYLINQFIVAHTNHRQDEWGGDFQHRIQFALAIVQGIRERLGPEFIIVFRLSLLDLVPQGSVWDEIVALAQALERVGATMLNTGIGWHEAKIPTIASVVPEAAFITLTQQLRSAVKIPLIATNRITTPEQADQILASGTVDMIAMARPFLADPLWVEKARNQHEGLINVCIACNQACLDHVFVKKPASCLVNPQAGYELELVTQISKNLKSIAVVGGGPAGLAFAHIAAVRGHQVTVFEALPYLGGQFCLAQKIPGKQAYQETITYYQRQLDKLGVEIRCNIRPDPVILGDFDEVVFATGVKPRIPDIIGVEHKKVVTYVEALHGQVEIGQRVAVIGAGGIGIDVVNWLLGEPVNFYQHWGIDLSVQEPGGLVPAQVEQSTRKIFLLQRKSGRIGGQLGKTTAWIHRLDLKRRGIEILSGVQYQKINDLGLILTMKQQPVVLEVDTIILCCGQLENSDLYHELHAMGQSVHLIGGAYRALELDAKQAIAQATRLGLLI